MVFGTLLGTFGLLLFVCDVTKTLLWARDFALPMRAVGLVEPLVGVAFDLHQAENVARRHPKHGPTIARVLVLACVWCGRPYAASSQRGARGTRFTSTE